MGDDSCMSAYHSVSSDVSRKSFLWWDDENRGSDEMMLGAWCSSLNPMFSSFQSEGLFAFFRGPRFRAADPRATELRSRLHCCQHTSAKVAKSKACIKNINIFAIFKPEVGDDD